MIRILIPTDFSEQAKYAYIMASKFANKIDAELQFLNVISWSEPELDEKGNKKVVDGDDEIALAKNLIEAETKMKEWKKSTNESIPHQLIFGPVTKSIIDYAEKNLFDLIVMGTKGATGLKSWLSGTDTQFVVRNSSVPVLSLMCDRSELEIKNLLLVHDFDNEDDKYNTSCIKLMKAINSNFGSTINLLHITKNDEKDNEKIINKLNDFAVKHEFCRFKSYIHKDSNLEDGVNHFNQMHDMDIIFIGTKIKSGWKRFLESDVAESMVKHTYKPIITFKSK
jgi:nucleotide-binding universal stress UspA family protein